MNSASAEKFKSSFSGSLQESRRNLGLDRLLYKPLPPPSRQKMLPSASAFIIACSASCAVKAWPVYSLLDVTFGPPHFP